jgi:hypothetical protein
MNAGGSTGLQPYQLPTNTGIPRVDPLKMPIWAKCKVMCKLKPYEQHKCRRHDEKLAQDGGARRALFPRRAPESWVR